jgi:hypothetical protein
MTLVVAVPKLAPSAGLAAQSVALQSPKSKLRIVGRLYHIGWGAYGCGGWKLWHNGLRRSDNRCAEDLGMDRADPGQQYIHKKAERHRVRRNGGEGETHLNGQLSWLDLEEIISR